MEINLRGSSKGQLMTILVLVLFLLMLASLVAYITLGINANGNDQIAVQSLSSSAYGRDLAISAQSFASASAQRALSTLFNYEYNPSMRRDNFISNTSEYMSWLIANGTLPNVPQGAAANSLLAGMANLTLRSYNAHVIGSLNIPYSEFSVSETQPVISQDGSYALTVSYNEHVLINASGSIYNYTIPVNASIQLNGTPDLFYAQQGVFQQISFAELDNLTSAIGGEPAQSGNTTTYAYGTAYQVPASMSSDTCATLSTLLFNAPFDKGVILVTSNPGALGGCAGLFAGIITNVSVSGPGVPYLIYPTNSTIPRSIESGRSILLYGPTLSTYDISGLIAAASGGYYFASPLAPSYLERAQSSLMNDSPDGVVAFSGYDRQAASLSGSMAAFAANSVPFGTSAETQVVWVYLNSLPAPTSAAVVTMQSGGVGGLSVGNTGTVAFSIPTVGGVTTTNSISSGGWYMLSGTYSGSLIEVCIDASMCVNTSASGSIPASGNPFDIGSLTNGYVASVQVYNSSLTRSELTTLFQNGVSDVPAGNSGLVGWWPLNGNPNDYSGNGNNAASSPAIPFTVAPGYARDSFLSRDVGQVWAVPGVLNCDSVSQCDNNALPHVYLGGAPLEIGQKGAQTAAFSGPGSNVTIPSAPQINASGEITLAVWFRLANTTANSVLVSKTSSVAGFDDFNLSVDDQNLQATLTTSGGTATTPLGTLVVNNDTWYFAAVTYGGAGTMMLYLNGTPEPSTAVPAGLLSNSINPIKLGFSEAVPSSLNGSLADVQIYNRSLSAPQVAELYRRGVYGMPLSSNGLVGWWPLNGNAKDYSGFADNGTTANISWVPMSGVYDAPGLSSPVATLDEWQSMGLSVP